MPRSKAAWTYSLPSKRARRVIRAEFYSRVDTVPPAGARGLMGLKPATGHETGATDPFAVPGMDRAAISGLQGNARSDQLTPGPTNGILPYHPNRIVPACLSAPRQLG